MAENRGMGRTIGLAFFRVLPLALLLCWEESALAALRCSDCHRMPPLDAAYRNISTGAVRGNHQTHQPAVATPATCAPCHAGSDTYATDHRDGVIQLSDNINNSPRAATYSKGVFFNQTSLPLLGTCANTNCHFEAVTPTWGSAPLVSPAGCNACHGAPPSTGSHPFTGQKHAAYYGTTTASCARCHPDHTATARPFAHATSAGKRALLLQFTASPNSGGTYSKTVNLNYPSYLPSQTTAANRNGTCANMYCHSDGTGGGPVITPTWGGTLPADCTGCHGGNAASARAIVTGLHGQHANNAAILGTNYGCAACHAATVGAGSDRAVTGTASHVEGVKSVSFSGSGTFAATTKTCSATSCHAAGKSTAPQPPAPVWTGAAIGCNGCHGSGNAFGMPDYANGGAAAALANSHARHAFTASDCDKCHTNTTVTGTAIKAGSTLHTNNVLDVTFNTAKSGAGATWTAASKSCSATSCHGSGTPVWGGTLPVDCTACHGGDAASASVITTGRHAPHINNAAVLGAGNNLGCVDCHAKTVSANRTVSNPTLHVNGFADYSGVRAGGSAKYSSTTKVCSNIYCHSNGNAAAIVYVNPSAWSGTGTLGCNGCHGTSNATTGAPDYANGAAGTATANSHQKHVAGAGITDTKGCANCHAKTVDAGVAGKFRNYSTLHLNGLANVQFSAAIGGSYNSSAASCSATYCHGTAASPAWGSASLACNSCHSANSLLPGSHNRHWESTAMATAYTAPPGNSGTASQYQFACTSCHGAPANHANGPANANGAAQVFFGYSTTGMKGSYGYGTTQGTDNGFEWTNGSCATTYCHSNGAGGAGANTTFTWATPSGTLSCTGCHGGATTMATGRHAAHVNNAAALGTNLGCVDCHAKTVSSNTAISNKLAHVNKFRDYSGARAGGSARYNAATKSCTNIYCHSGGKGNYVNPPAWTSTTTMGCNGCHGTGNAAGTPDYANGGTAAAMANSHARHVATATDCDTCHTGTTTSGTAIKAGSLLHLNGALNVTFNTTKAGTGATWTAAGKTCATTYCHGAGRPAWGGTLPTDCTGCHGGGSASSAPIATNNHPTHLTSAYGPSVYLGTGVSACQTCHTYSATQPDPKHADGIVELVTGTGSACANCHAGAVPSWTTTTRVACTQCHAVAPARLPNGVAAPYKANYTSTGHGQFAASNQCTACHNQNSAHISGVLGDAVRLTLPNDNSQCGSCHNNTTAPAMSTHVLDRNATPNLCKACHDVHGTANIRMIRSTINGVTITFTNLSSGFVRTSAPYNGLCQVCHTLTNHYRAGAAETGHPTKNCLSCHNHNAAYAFMPSTACDSCHGYPPAPPGFAGSQGNYSSARVQDYVNGGGAHTIAGHIKKDARPSEGWANCTVCHGNGSLSPATHLMSPVPPQQSNVTIDVDDQYKFNNTLPLDRGKYTGPLNGSGTTGRCSNTSCHFGPSPLWAP